MYIKVDTREFSIILIGLLKELMGVHSDDDFSVKQHPKHYHIVLLDIFIF